MRSLVALACQHCGTAYEVERRKIDRSRFCSRPCQNAAATLTNPHRPCAVCGETFKPRRADQQTCSIGCRDKNMPARGPSPMKGRLTAERITSPCQHCGVPVTRVAAEMRANVFCSRQCFGKSALRYTGGQGRPRAPVGTERLDGDGGYMRERTETGWKLQHRLVMERQLGRPLLAAETVHHRNGIKTDNRPENLELRAGRHGKHQNVDDLVEEAVEVLIRYAPERLR